MTITVNGEERTLSDGATIDRLLDALKVSRGAFAIEVNREIVPKATHGQHVLKDGDRVEIVTFVGGG